jgi:hypothetical protein
MEMLCTCCWLWGGGEGREWGGLIAIVFETRPKNHNLRKKLIKNKYITARE